MEKTVVLDGWFSKDWSLETGATTLEFHGLVDGEERVGPLETIMQERLKFRQGTNSERKFCITIKEIP